MKSKPTVGIIAIVFGAFLALIPLVILPVCSNMIEMMNGKSLFMKCHWTAMAELLAGILIVFDGILLIGFKKQETRIALSIMLLLFGLTALLITTIVIGMCETATMPCRVGAKPALIVVSVLTMVVGIGNIFSQHFHKERSTIE